MKKSELILNPDGSVYHLALKPGEVSDVVITVGDPERVGRVTQHFSEVELRVCRREFVTHTGTYKGRRLTVISTGIGTDNVDIVLNELHSLKEMEESVSNPFRFIRLGTSGSVRPEIPVNSVLISKAALGFDGLLHFYEHPQQVGDIEKLLTDQPSLKKLPQPYIAFAAKSLLHHFSRAADYQGVTVTAPGFYAPQGRNVNAPAVLPDFLEILGVSNFQGEAITNIEMETAGIYGLASLLGHEAISLSAILANRATGDFSDKADAVVEELILNALKLTLTLD